MFHMPPTNFRVPGALPYYLLLGVVCGGAADRLHEIALLGRGPVRSPAGRASSGIRRSARSASESSATSCRACSASATTPSPPSSTTASTWKLLLLIAVFKSIALVISLGSGTSGGLLAPMFMASAALGGIFATGINRLIPSAELAPGAFALVAMGAVFGAAARATFAFIVFAFEITRDYNAVLPLMLVCVIADAIAIRFLPNSIMTEKLARRGLDTHSEYEAVVLKRLRVRDVMAGTSSPSRPTKPFAPSPIAFFPAIRA